MSSSTVETTVPSATQVHVSDDALTVELSDGRSISVPLAWFPRLTHGTAAERTNWRLIAGGRGIHWTDLDEDISVENLLAGKPSGESQTSFKKWLENRSNAHTGTRVYRKLKGGDTWHFCRNCSTWPTSDFEERSSSPATGELCDECQAKLKAQSCSA